jgi:hypothetical protein
MNQLGYSFWLYGSAARGEDDDLSDYDILAVGTQPLPDYLRLRDRLSVSRYQLHEIESMAAYGSLFLQHVKLEGWPLLEVGVAADRLRELLVDLPPYSRVKSDLISFRQAIDDVRLALAGPCSPLFEASSLAMVVRHIAILGNYVLNAPCFSREGAIVRLGSKLGIQMCDINPLLRLQRYRLHEEGRCAVLGPTVDLLAGWTDLANNFLTALERRINVPSKLQTAGAVSQGRGLEP